MTFTQLYWKILDKKIARLLMNDDPIEEIHRQILELKSMVAMAPELNREVLLRRIREMQENVETAMNEVEVEE